MSYSNMHKCHIVGVFFLSWQKMAEKLKEAEEAQRVLQVDCETYKKVLAETVN